MRIVLLSDIHANVSAFLAVIQDVKSLEGIDAYVLLGDLINYGPRPNEVIEIVKQLSKPIMVNLWGNHEYSIFGGSLDRFSTDRGRAVLGYTDSILTKESRDYLDVQLNHAGCQEEEIEGDSFLFVHGNLDDPYWGKFGIDSMNDSRYAKYDFVVTGHSHVPHYLEHFFDSNKVEFRNKKRTTFINPGSVGQPRNQNPYAQYGILDSKTGNYEHRAVWYDVKEEQSWFNDKVDSFYKTRLSLGI